MCLDEDEEAGSATADRKGFFFFKPVVMATFVSSLTFSNNKFFNLLFT